MYSPHGAGIVVAKEHRDDAFGEYLSIRIAHSKMTLMVPAVAAKEKGVRSIISKTAADKLIKELGGDANELAENPQLRARQAADKTRGGEVEQLASIIRDFAGRKADGKKLSASESKSVQTATLMLASEIALALDIDIAAATEQLEGAVKTAE
ncbi:MAG: hypothetical protein H7123_05365 [Thermoleophilia bacterium]|nr:hypothetical protein [Thermoleophilia bacterium]